VESNGLEKGQESLIRLVAISKEKAQRSIHLRVY
jgi:hypothetical protein